jgi:hypothetical protein
MKEWEERVETWIIKTASQMRASTHVPGFVLGLITFFFFINHQFLTSNTCSDIADFFGANVACGKRDQKGIVITKPRTDKIMPRQSKIFHLALLTELLTNFYYPGNLRCNSQHTAPRMIVLHQ